jgi:hypothetical protein
MVFGITEAIGLVGGIGSAIGGAVGGGGGYTPPSGEEFLNSYMDTLGPIYDEENQFTKKETKKQKKKANKLFGPSKADQDRAVRDTVRNWDAYEDSLFDSAMRGEIDSTEALSRLEGIKSASLMNWGSQVNQRGDTALSKYMAAEKKIREEVEPRERLGRATSFAATIMGRGLTDQEKAYYTNSNLFKTGEDVATAMRMTEEGGSRFIGDADIEQQLKLLGGGRLVNPTAKNTYNQPYKMRKAAGLEGGAEAVTQQRVV